MDRALLYSKLLSLAVENLRLIHTNPCMNRLHKTFISSRVPTLITLTRHHLDKLFKRIV
jgi:hypothetical protein